MADKQIGNVAGVAARGGKNTNGGSGDRAGLVLTNAASLTVDQLRTRLAAAAPGTYTASYLNTMSYNDMVYALRLIDAPGTI